MKRPNKPNRDTVLAGLAKTAFSRRVMTAAVMALAITASLSTFATGGTLRKTTVVFTNPTPAQVGDVTFPIAVDVKPKQGTTKFKVSFFIDNRLYDSTQYRIRAADGRKKYSVIARTEGVTSVGYSFQADKFYSQLLAPGNHSFSARVYYQGTTVAADTNKYIALPDNDVAKNLKLLSHGEYGLRVRNTPAYYAQLNADQVSLVRRDDPSIYIRSTGGCCPYNDIFLNVMRVGGTYINVEVFSRSLTSTRQGNEEKFNLGTLESIRVMRGTTQIGFYRPPIDGPRGLQPLIHSAQINLTSPVYDPAAPQISITARDKSGIEKRYYISFDRSI